MSTYVIKKGLDLPISGEPEQTISTAPTPTRVALLAEDYVGMKPTMYVRQGDRVQRGQLLFDDKKTPGVRYTAIASGTVVAVNRGERRAFHSLVIELDESEHSGSGRSVPFDSYTGRPVAALDREQTRALLLESGMWTALRSRPFGRVPNPADMPAAVFVTAMDTNPLAASVDAVLAGNEKPFTAGLEALAKLIDGPVHVCKAPGSSVPTPAGGQISISEFAGPHPAGSPGVHIHMIKPVSRKRSAWYVNYQDVIAIGVLFLEGVLFVDRVISFAGPAAKNPRLLHTRLGASTDDLSAGELIDGENRVISGSILSGRKAHGEIFGYLGRYHLQISAIREGREREILGWLAPGWNKFSLTNVYAGKFIPGRKFGFTSSTNGSPRAMVPIGLYERVVPMDIMPTQLLRAILMHDTETAEELGVLELEEEDVALCSFVCPGKSDYGPLLRKVLTTIEKEG
jgi:Na+-transporting NADH:ubiquinone oxidoreductase subunit A